MQIRATINASPDYLERMSMRLKTLALVFALAVAGCAPARIPVDEALASGEFLEAHGRNGWKIRERVTFGAFSAERIDRSWTRGRGFTFNQLELDLRSQTYSFALAESGRDVLATSCQAEVRRGAIDVRSVELEFRNRSRLECEMRSAGGQVAWTLKLDEEHETPLVGTLMGVGRTYRVEGTNALRKGLPAIFTTGYYVRRGQTAFAAVEVVNAGGVWLGADLPGADRTAVAAVAAALLLFEDLRGTIESA